MLISMRLLASGMACRSSSMESKTETVGLWSPGIMSILVFVPAR